MLADLDELVLRCRDERAKAYIGEAVACYRAGAYRAAIISTWIAVAFDIIDKIRELSFAGDKAAAELTELFDAITRDNDLARSLQFERDLLTNARDRFELVSAQEFADLERLQQDRNRCAHPSRTAAMEVFTPSAELARAHIRAAVDHLLAHEPAQGKAAFDNVLKTIESDYFPKEREQALAVLTKTPLRRARISLVRNLIVVLIKAILHREPGEVWSATRRTAALMAIRQMHPEIWQKTIRGELSRIVRTLDTPEQLSEAVELVDLDPAFAEALEDDQILRLNEFIRQLQPGKLYVLAITNVLSKGRLQSAALERVRSLKIAEFADFEFFGLPLAVCDRAAHCYVNADSFDEANAWGQLVIKNAGDFNTEQAVAILQAAVSNGQVRGSFGLPRVLDALEKANKFPSDARGKLAEVRAMIESS